MSKPMPWSADYVAKPMRPLKVGDKVRVVYRYDRLIVRELVAGGHVRCEFESGYGGFSGPQEWFVRGWLKK